MNSPVTHLEEIIAHHSRDIASLSEELYRQQGEIAELRLQLSRLRDKMVNGDNGIRKPEEETLPPHY